MLRYTGQTHSRKNMWVESFLTMANSKFLVNKLNCVGHRMFLFLLKLRQALTNKPFMAADCWRLGYNFHVYSYLAATYKSTGTPCQNNTFMDRWLKVCERLHVSIFDIFFFFFEQNRHFVAEKYPKYLSRGLTWQEGMRFGAWKNNVHDPDPNSCGCDKPVWYQP